MFMVNAFVVSTKFQLRIKKIKRAAHKGITGKCKGGLASIPRKEGVRNIRG